MDAAAIGQKLANRVVGNLTTVTALGLFAGTLFVSALLLFSVQPMFARMVLPKLGGSPSVWAVSMCFFQAILLAGYCYAHVLNRFATPRLAPLIHLVLLAIAVLALPIGLPASRAEPPAGDAYLWLIVTLGLGVGLPFFAVSANAPLLQSWFAKTGHPHAKDPYFLYGASNLGSLIALLAYPVLLEPFTGLHTQAAMWAAGFVLLGLAIAFCGLTMLMNPAEKTTSPAAANLDAITISAPQAAAPTWAQRFGWVGLAAIPSGLLVAYSSYVSTDIASAPFLWVMPLAAFLATFILVFKERPTINHKLLLTLQPALLGGVLFGLATPGDRGWMIASICGTAAFFVTTMVAHRELYEQRPAPEHLTEFYLWMSLGGVVGGMFAALFAPQIFNSIWEFPLLLVAGMACRPGVLAGFANRRDVRDVAVLAVVAVAVMAGVSFAMQNGYAPQTTLPRIFFICGFGLVTLLSAAQPMRQMVYAAIMGLTVAVLPSAMNRGDAERSFFGVHRVASTADKEMRLLMHGTTIHGAERLVDSAGNKIANPLPATYYYPSGPMARGVDAARVASGKLKGGLKVGIVGLGAGSMACYARGNESWRFYEIDPVVVKIARDPARFSFLDRCRPNADIVLGDARLTLAKEPAQAFDYLIIDAFSSDSVPVHLMTVEAVKLYTSKLAPDGILALHVSNRHLDLVTVVGAVANAVPGLKVQLADDRTQEKGFDSAASHVVFITKSDAAMQPVRVFPFVTAMPEAATAPWTDDYSNILTAIWRKYR